MAALLAAGLWGALLGSWRLSLSLPVLVSLLAALAWVLTTPYSGLWRTNLDLKMHFTLLLDLGRGGWPTYLTDYQSSNPPLLSYYIGHIIVPGLVGRWLGHAALSWAFPLWISVGIGLIIYLFIRGLSTLRAVLIAVAVAIFSSGMNALELVLQFGPRIAFGYIQRGEIFVRYRILPGDERLLPQYLPISNHLWHSPQHLIASGLVSLIILQSRHQPRFKTVSVLIIAICLFWSPLAAIGVVPLAATLIGKKDVQVFLKWPNLLAAPLLIFLIAMYFNNDVPSNFGWLWQYYTDHTQMLIDLMYLYLTGFVLLAFVLWRLDRQIIKEPVFVVSLVVLTVAPWFIYRTYPDYIVKTVTVPVMVALAYLTSRIVISRLPETQPRSKAVISSTSLPGRGMYALLIVILVIGGLTPLSVLLESENNPDTLYKQSERTSLIHQYPGMSTQHSMSTIPVLLQTLLRKHDSIGLSTADLIIRSRYNVYLQEQDSSLVYLNRNCNPRYEKHTRFFLHVYPIDTNELPTNRKQVGYEIRDNKWGYYEGTNRHDYYNYKMTNICVATFGLPDYAISRITTGQYTPYLGLEWAIEYQFNDRGQAVVNPLHRFDHSETYKAYHSYYQLALANEPIIQSHFNVYLIQLHQDTLVYTKNNCISSDLPDPFFLHVIPADTNDLTIQRRQTGFDNYDFNFDDRGIIFDNKCLAVIPIPDYDIAAIRTGQWHPADGRRLWSEETSLNQ